MLTKAVAILYLLGKIEYSPPFFSFLFFIFQLFLFANYKFLKNKSKKDYRQLVVTLFRK